jgi:hypothetical protein
MLLSGGMADPVVGAKQLRSTGRRPILEYSLAKTPTLEDPSSLYTVMSNHKVNVEGILLLEQPFVRVRVLYIQPVVIRTYSPLA